MPIIRNYSYPLRVLVSYKAIYITCDKPEQPIWFILIICKSFDNGRSFSIFHLVFFTSTCGYFSVEKKVNKSNQLVISSNSTKKSRLNNFYFYFDYSLGNDDDRVFLLALWQISLILIFSVSCQKKISRGKKTNLW